MAKNAFLTRLAKRADQRQTVKTETGNVEILTGKAVLEIPLEKISEDPTQPRTEDNAGFSEEAIGGLADSITANGLLQPISVHTDPDKPGHYIINHGARRYRAMLKTGKKTISAIVDDDYSQQKQLIENLQRENLSMPEIVESLAKIRPLFASQRELAKAVGKSDAWIAQMLVLTKLTPEINELMTSGKCQDTLVLNQLQKLSKDNPGAAHEFIEQGNYSRGALETFKKSLIEEEEETSTVETPETTVADDPEEKRVSIEPDVVSTVETKKEDAEEVTEPKEKETQVRPVHYELSSFEFEFDGRKARLVLNRPVLIQFDDGTVKAVQLTGEDI